MTSTILLAVAFVLLVAGVVGSVTPQVPGAALSLAGVLVYWWATGFTEPGTLLLVSLVAVGVFTLIVDWMAGALAARIGGASTWTAVLAGVVGLVLFLVTGPVGIILGVAGTVFVAELYRQRDARASARAALITTGGMLGSTVVQVVLTASMLLAVLAIALV